MSKRLRDEEAAPGQSLVTDAETRAAEASAQEDADAMSALAGWCDDQLREVGELFPQDKESSGNLQLPDVASVREWVDCQFASFVDALESERSMILSEEHRGLLAEGWRKTATDTVRVYCMRNARHVCSPCIDGFHFNSVAAESCHELDNKASELYEEWIFTLGWKLAHSVTHACTENDESEASDEPVEESEEDEGEEEESSEGESGEEGSSSSEEQAGE